MTQRNGPDDPVTLPRAALEALLAEAAELGARKALQASRLAAVSDRTSLPTPSHMPFAAAAAWESEWCDVKRAMHELNRSRDRAVATIRRHGLGCMVDSRWNVDLNRVRAYRENRPYPPLKPIPSE